MIRKGQDSLLKYPDSPAGCIKSKTKIKIKIKNKHKKFLRIFFRFLLFALLFFSTYDCAAWAGGNAGANHEKKSQAAAVRYQTPLFGQGFKGRVFGKEITVAPFNTRSISSWVLGAGLEEPPPEDSELLPVGSLYFWRHPDSAHLLRADVSGVYDDIFWARRLTKKNKKNKNPFWRHGGLEAVLTFNNFTLPVARAELVDGRSLSAGELLWGYVRAGFGLGYRRQVSPGLQDNMFAVDLILEPGFLYFDKGPDTAAGFSVPENTPELRARLQVRLDALKRNILKLAHQGYAAGAELVYGYRTDWRDWGTADGEKASEGREYLSFTGYFLKAGGLPWTKSSRQRFITSINGGVGYHLDRFSAPRVGGGPDPMGEEYGSTWMPVLPGAAIWEFFPHHYVLLTGEYRYEPIFFTYLGLDAAAGWLDRLRNTLNGPVSKNDLMSSAGVRITTGFFFNTRLQIDYNYNFSVIRKGSYGGNEFLVQLSGDL